MNILVSKLDKVRSHGKGRYVACCPAHNDKSPSMTIREMDDGRILFHCFAGCSPDEILSAVGLTFSDVMPESCGNHIPKERMPYSAKQLLQAIAQESLVIASCAANGMKDRERYIKASSRILAALKFAEGL